MNREIIDILTIIVAFIVLHYVVFLLVVFLLLVRACPKLEPWRCALESWNKERRKWRDAKASLRRATRDLKRAQWQTRKRPKGMEAVEKGEAENCIRARKDVASTYREFKAACKQQDAAGRDVHKWASDHLRCKFRLLRVVAWKLQKTPLKLAGAVCCAFKSAVVYMLKNYSLIGGGIRGRC